MNNIDFVLEEIEKLTRLERESNERKLADLIQNYDFIVGSMECKHILTKVLPKDANVIYSPYIEDPDLVYAVKKYDIFDILKQEREEN